MYDADMSKCCVRSWVQGGLLAAALVMGSGCEDEESSRLPPDASVIGPGGPDAGVLDSAADRGAADVSPLADALGEDAPPSDAGADALPSDAGGDATAALPLCTLPAEAQKTAILRVTADDYVRIWFNGALVAEPNSLWGVLKQYDVQVFLNGGKKNVIAVEARNEWKQSGLDRGFIAELAYTVADVTFFVNTDASWKVSTSEATNWTALDFDDSAWATPVVLGPSGIAPWGPVVFNTNAAWLWSYLPNQAADAKVDKETLWFRKVFFMNDQGLASDVQPCR